jgi:hypothetical protein
MGKSSLSAHRRKTSRESASAKQLSVSPSLPERKFLTLSECKDELQCSRRFLQLEITRGRLIAVRLTKQMLRVRASDWQRYLESGRTLQS